MNSNSISSSTSIKIQPKMKPYPLIVISGFGTALGLIAGLLIGLAAVPVMDLFIDTMDFGIAFSLDSFLIIAILAVSIGLIFGTYPALKAANLTPVAAIRHK